MARALLDLPDSTRLAVWRIQAGWAGLTVLVGAVALGRAVVANQGWWYDGFISEVGEPGSPQSPLYRWGILGIAFGLFQLSTALAITMSRLSVRAANRLFVGAAAGLLLLAGGLATTSGLVSCSAGCPLPPYEQPTVGDLVHAGASIGGMLACGAAMLALALSPDPTRVRTISRAWLVVTIPLGVFAAASLIVAGRGTVTGTAEKLVLVVIIAWAVVLAGSLAAFPPVSVPTPSSDP